MIIIALSCCDFLYFSIAVFNWGSTKTHLFSESRNRKGAGVERDVKPRNMNFAKVYRRGGGGATNRERALIWINTVCFCKQMLHQSLLNKQLKN